MWKIAVAVILVVAAAFCFIEFCGVYICDGGYDLEVRVTSSSQSPIDTVSCNVVGHPTDVFPEPLKPEQVLATCDFATLSHLSANWQCADRPFTGEPFAVWVPVTQRVSIWFERDLGYNQFRTLIIAVEYQSGKRAGRVVEIPDGRVSRSVSIAVP